MYEQQFIRTQVSDNPPAFYPRRDPPSTISCIDISEQRTWSRSSTSGWATRHGGRCDPYTYLVDVLQRVGRHRASRVDELTPRRWKQLFAEAPLRSDLHKLAA
jgi:hypothetical protein